MTQTPAKSEIRLPIRGFLVVFLTVLVIVAATAAIFGENNKINITARRMMEGIASGDFDGAYGLLTDSAQKRIDPRKFEARMAPLRTYLRALYGAGIGSEYKFTSRARFWIPGLEESRRAVVVGVYRKEPGIKSEIKEMLFAPKLAGAELQDLLVIVRQSGRWLVDDINFDPEKYASVIKKAKGKDYLSATQNGFVLDGFVYDRRTTSPEERAIMMDALSQALQELQKDSGVKKQGSDDMMKMLRP